MNRRLWAYASGAVVFIAVLWTGLFAVNHGWPEVFERRITDQLARQLPPASTSGRVVIVKIDDRSLEELGERWPLSRETWARFVAAISRFEPSVLAIDVLFDQPSSQEALDLVRGLHSRMGEESQSTSLHRFLEDQEVGLNHDLRLSREIAAAGNVVLATVMQSHQDLPRSNQQRTWTMKIGDLPHDTTRKQFGTEKSSISSLAIAARTHGNINLSVESDGLIRRYPYVSQMGESVRASLALSAVAVASSASSEWIAEKRQQLVELDGGEPLLSLTETEAHPSVSFADVLFAADASPNMDVLLRDKIVFVGAAAAAIGDLWSLPGRPVTPGVVAHAIAADNLLTDQHRISEGIAAWVGTLSALILMLGLLLLWRLKGGLTYVLGIGALAFLTHNAIGLGLLAWQGWAMPMVPVGLGIVALTALRAGAAISILQSQRRDLLEKEKIAAAIADQERYLRNIVEHVADGILVLTGNGTVASANPAACAILGYSGDELVGKPVKKIFTDDLLQRNPAKAEANPTDPTGTAAQRCTTEATRADGHSVHIDVASTHMTVDAQPLQLAIIRDVSKQKAMEEMKQNFVSTVSHELRTPLTSIRGSLGLLAGGALGEIPATISDTISIAHANSERLVRLVNDILDIQRLESGKMALTLEAHDARQLLDKALALNADLERAHGVSFVTELPGETLSIRVDGDRIIQVFTNLLSNAAKFSPAQSKIFIQVKRHGEILRISVRDQGPGIPPAFQPHVFSRFAQARPSDATRKGGSGLGLSIVKSLIEQHGGRVGFESPPGSGATFWFELPIESFDPKEEVS